MKTLKTVLEEFAMECSLTAAAAARSMNLATAQAKAWEADFPDAARRRHDVAAWEFKKKELYERMSLEATALAQQCEDQEQLPPFPGY